MKHRIHVKSEFSPHYSWEDQGLQSVVNGKLQKAVNMDCVHQRVDDEM